MAITWSFRTRSLWTLLIISTSMYSVSVRAVPTTGFLHDWLLQEVPAAAGAAVEVCLQEVADARCRCFEANSAGACLKFGAESTFACCTDSGKQASADSAPLEAAASCIFTEDYFTEAVPYLGTAASTIGRFSALCTFDATAHTCTSSIPTGLRFKASGDIVRYQHIAFVGRPAAPAQDEACKAAPEGPLSSKDDFSNTGNTSTPAAAQSMQLADTGYYAGSGDVYVGTIHGATAKAAGDTGRFQLVYVRELSSSAPLAAPPEQHFVAQPFTLTLQLPSSSL